MSAMRILITVVLLLITAQARATSLKDLNAESKTEQAQAVTGFIDLSIEESWLLLEKQSGPRWSGSLREVLLDQERKIIVAALVESRGKIAGQNGAAGRLGVPSSTLDTKIKQFRIEMGKLVSKA